MSAASDDPPPVSWFLIERGWKVLGADGAEIGTVEETVGDSNHDIFDGLTVRTGLLERSRYVPAEEVDSIVEGRITLKFPAGDAERLHPYDEPPPSEQIVTSGGSWWARLVDSLRRPRR